MRGTRGLVENERGVSCPSPRVEDASEISTETPPRRTVPPSQRPTRKKERGAVCHGAPRGEHRRAFVRSPLRAAYDVARAHVAVCPFERRGSRGQAHHLLELLDEDAPVAEQVLDRPRIVVVARRLEAASDLGADLGAGLGGGLARRAERLAHQRKHLAANDERLQVHPADARASPV